MELRVLTRTRSSSEGVWHEFLTQYRVQSQGREEAVCKMVRPKPRGVCLHRWSGRHCTNTRRPLRPLKQSLIPMGMGSAVTAGIVTCWRLVMFACPKVCLEEIVIRDRCRRRDWIFRTLDSCLRGSRFRLNSRRGLHTSRWP